ncbi:MAG: gfo/Idh/MocA family oxidoreductase [Verrucomicrobiota bacterium]
MNPLPTPLLNPTARRQFLSTSGKALAGAAVLTAVARPGYTAEANTIKIALVGCGGRGSGAVAQALSTQGPTQLWAIADFFGPKIQNTLGQLQKRFPNQADKVTVPKERQFTGLDGFKRAIDTLDKGSVVLLATPPAFRPQHVEYAVQKGMHVFMEKSFGVDAPGSRRILKAGAEATKQNLKIAGGLMTRHSKPTGEAIEQIHQGIIGDVITTWAYRMHGPVKYQPRQPDQSELAHQIVNYSCYTWLNGTFLLDWLIHNIDVCCWVKNEWPASVQGMGGRQMRQEPDQLFDHYSAEYTFADGTRMLAQARHMAQCWGFFGDVIQGAKGCAVLGEGVPSPRIYKGHRQAPENLIWQYQGPKSDAYQFEHDLLFDAIRNDKPCNESERCVKTNLTAIMGRMACESGRMITWEEVMNSNAELAPGLDTLTNDANPPVMPDANGQYPVAKPGVTNVL